MLSDIGAQYIIWGIIGIGIVLFIAFFSLLFLTRKKRPGQGAVGQVMSGISEANMIDQMPTAQPVQIVAQRPDSQAPNTLPQAFDPTTGASMVNSNNLNETQHEQIEQNTEILRKEDQIKPKIETVNSKIDKLDEKIEQLNKKLDSQS